jgi:hypothetical protein
MSLKLKFQNQKRQHLGLQAHLQILQAVLQAARLQQHLDLRVHLQILQAVLQEALPQQHRGLQVLQAAPQVAPLLMRLNLPNRPKKLIRKSSRRLLRKSQLLRSLKNNQPKNQNLFQKLNKKKPL